MNEEEMNKFKKYMGRSDEFKIDGEVFSFKPLKTIYIPEYLYVIEASADLIKQSKELANKENITEKELVEHREKEKKVNEIIVKLIEIMVKESYPDLNDEVLNNFIVSNYFRLQEILFSINKDAGMSKLDKRTEKALNELKQKINAKQNESNQSIQS